MGPFRRMLVMRIASTHAGLLQALTVQDNWTGNWGRPRVRSFSASVAALYANLSSAVLSNGDLLQPDEQQAIGKYSEHLFALQSQFEHIDKKLNVLSSIDVMSLAGIITQANAAIQSIAEAFEESYQTQISDLLWTEEDRKSVNDNLLTPLDSRARTIAARALAPAVRVAPAMAPVAAE